MVVNLEEATALRSNVAIYQRGCALAYREHKVPEEAAPESLGWTDKSVVASADSVLIWLQGRLRYRPLSIGYGALSFQAPLQVIRVTGCLMTEQHLSESGTGQFVGRKPPPSE